MRRLLPEIVFVLCFVFAIQAADRKFLAIAPSDRRPLPEAVRNDPDARVIATYPVMHAISLPERALERIADRLERAGFELRELPDVIYTPARKLETGVLQPAAIPDQSGLFVIQFVAPATEQWQAALRARGIEIVDALPERAAIVSARPDAMRSLAREKWIQYAAPFAADQKAGQRAVSPSDLYYVQIATTGAAEGVLEHFRVRFKEFLYETHHATDAVVLVRANAAEAQALLNEPFVVAVDPYFPQGLSDERQALGVTGLSVLTSTTTKYLNWLNSSARNYIVPNNLTNDQWGRKIIVDVADTGVDLGCCAYDSIRHYDLLGRVVYNGGTFKVQSSGCTLQDTSAHGTVVATIAGGLPVTGQNSAGGTVVTYNNGAGFKDSDSLGQYFYGMGIAPGIRIGNTRITDGSSFDDGDASNGNGVADWTRIAVTAKCNTPASLCTQNEACGATVQTHSHNEYTDNGDRAGIYSMDSREFDFRVRDANGTDDGAGPNNTPLAITISAGNYRQRAGDASTMVLPPATAKNIIAVGAVETHRTAANWPKPPDTPGGAWTLQTTPTVAPTCMAPTGNDLELSRHSASGFNNLAFVSRRGTIEGYRFKPEILAPATLVLGGQPKNIDGWCAKGPLTLTSQPFWPLYQGSSGTSFAAPVAAGSIALLRYYYDKNNGLTPSPAMYKAMLVAGARSIAGGVDRLETYRQSTTVSVGKWPSVGQGYGVINLTDLLSSTVTHAWRDQNRILLQGERVEYTATVVDPTKPLRVVMAYTDVPAAARTSQSDTSVVLVNDLSLRGISTNFVVWGNKTGTDGYSTLNPYCRSFCSTTDGTNNVEVLNINPSLFSDPANRTMTIRIDATYLQGVGVPGASGGAFNQDFALFVMNGTLQ